MLCKNLPDFPVRIDIKNYEIVIHLEGGWPTEIIVSEDRSPLIQHASVDVENDASTKDRGSGDLLTRRPESR